MEYNDRLVLLWTTLVMASTILGNDVLYGPIDLCEVKYVHPGSDFDITCKTDNGIATKIYTPTERIPTKRGLVNTATALAKSQETGGFPHNRRAITTINEYQNATLGVDEGIYTCYVIHGAPYDPMYSLAECEVIIQDLCVDNNCGLEQVCEPDYETGEHECTCNLGCQPTYEPICSQRCEMFFNPCAMREQTCKDQIFREIMNTGFCPEGETAGVRDISEEIYSEKGEELMLESGVESVGNPPVSVKWEFHPEDESDVVVLSPDSDPLSPLTVTVERAGVYRAVLKQCDEIITVNEYTVYLEEEVPLFSQLRYTCSVYPGGVIDTFHSTATAYDLACTHALAADFRPLDYSPAWFIYGTFDEHDGNTALQAMTFYLGRDIFEIQRGWIIHLNGVKMELDEGVEQNIPNTECQVVFAYWHLAITCPHFKARYDGIMSGHIALRPGVDMPYLPPKKRGTNIGLCWDARSGGRPNWQIGRRHGECQVDTYAPPCADPAPSQCSGLGQGPLNIPGPDIEWSACGVGAGLSCGELHCSDTTPTPVQRCALEQAERVSCALKREDVSSLEQAGGVNCPTDGCEWKLEVLARGCPQEYPPFKCLSNEVDTN